MTTKVTHDYTRSKRRWGHDLTYSLVDGAAYALRRQVGVAGLVKTTTSCFQMVQTKRATSLKAYLITATRTLCGLLFWFMRLVTRRKQHDNQSN